MKKTILATSLLSVFAAAPLVATHAAGDNANHVTIYGWVNQDYEVVDNDERLFDRINSNAGNIGFRGSFDTGVGGISANFQCEQFVEFERFAGNTGFCNRNSKVSLSGGFGEIMYGIWLLPANEIIAQTIDPFYDAGTDSHTALFGSVGYGQLFYNGGQFDVNSNAQLSTGEEFSYTGVFDTSFNRRQDGILQYYTPNLGGFQARIAATTSPDRHLPAGGDDLDPRIVSGGFSYTQGPVWFAVTGEYHQDWNARALDSNTTFGNPAVDSNGNPISNPANGLAFSANGSDSWTARVAANYIADWGGGNSSDFAIAFEHLDYELHGESYHSLFSDLEKNTIFASLKQDFPGPFDIRISGGYAFELNCGGDFAGVNAGGECGLAPFGQSVDENNSNAFAVNGGVFYQLGDQTELRLVYSRVENGDNAAYDFGIPGSGVNGNQGADTQALQAGIIVAF